jgi:hypothetical protein
MIVGRPGVGKTISSKPAMLRVTANIIEREELSRFEANYNDFIYNRVSEEEYFTGYRGQTVFFFDDIGQTRDVAGVLNSPYMESIRAINSNSWNLHMAALADKGTTAFSSKLVWATTNRRTFSKDLDSLYATHAFSRRWRAFWCCPKVSAALLKADGSPESDPYERCLDFTKVDPEDIDFQHLEWYPFDISNGNIIGSPINYDIFCTLIVSSYKDKHRFGSGMLNNDKRTIERELSRLRGTHEYVPQADNTAAIDVQCDELDELGNFRWFYALLRHKNPHLTQDEALKISLRFKDEDLVPHDAVEAELFIDNCLAQYADVMSASSRERSRINTVVDNFFSFAQSAKDKLASIDATMSNVAAILGVLTLGSTLYGLYCGYRNTKSPQQAPSDEFGAPQSSFLRAQPRQKVGVKALRGKNKGHLQRANPLRYENYQDQAEVNLNCLRTSSAMIFCIKYTNVVCIM